MERVAHRCIGAVAVGLTGLAMGGLIVGLAPVMTALPDVQVRDFGLTANLQVNLDSQIETVENHIRPDLAGGGGVDHAQVGLADLLFDRSAGTLNGLTDSTSNTSDFTLDQNELSNLLGGGFAPEALRQGLLLDPISIDAGIPNSGASGGVFSVNDPGGANAAGAAAASITGLVQSLPLAQQAFTSAIATAELQLNNALVDAQVNVIQNVGGDNTASDIASWIFNANNAVLAQNEMALNSLLSVGVNPDTIQSSLLADFAPGSAAAEADWNALVAGFSPADVSAVLHDNLVLLLNEVDLPSFMSSFLLGVF